MWRDLARSERWLVTEKLELLPPQPWSGCACFRGHAPGCSEGFDRVAVRTCAEPGLPHWGL